MDDFFIKKRAREEGEKAGEKRGEKRGKKIGKKEKQLEISKNLLKIGMEISKIAEVTG